MADLYGSFEGAKNFSDRHRSLELVIINATRHKLVWDESFFDSGTTFAGPVPLNVTPALENEPTGAVLWTVANGQGSFLTGVSGAGKWNLEGTELALVIGFTNPQFGSYKNEIGIVGRRAKPRLAYDASFHANAKRHNMMGYTVTAYSETAQGGGMRRFVYCIAEDKNNGFSDRGDLIKAEEYLTLGESIMSQNGQYVAYFEPEHGNLVVYNLDALRRVVGATGATRNSGVRCGLSMEGRFAVLAQNGRTTWEAPAAVPGGYLQLTNSGQLSLFDGAKKQVWTA